MRCQTCGDTTSPSSNECQNCHTPLGEPAVALGAATYAVRGIGLAASVAVGTTALFYLLAGLYPLVGVVLARRAADSGESKLLSGAVAVEVLLYLPFALAYLTAAVLVIIWTWRARKNLDAFPGALPYLGPGWAIAGWLVPFANLVVPVRVVANIARDSLWRRRTPALVYVWWTAWLVFNLGERFLNRVDDREYGRLPENPATDAGFQAYVDHYQAALGRNAVAVASCLVAAVSLIVLIRRISAAQQNRIARATPAWLGAPIWPAAPAPSATPASPGPAGYPAPQPVTVPSPQVPGGDTVASPPDTDRSGGTIRA